MTDREQRTILAGFALAGELARAESNVEAGQIAKFCVRLADQTVERLETGGNAVTEENARLRAALREVRMQMLRSTQPTGETLDHVERVISRALGENQSQ
jgi:hypothetical protein